MLKKFPKIVLYKGATSVVKFNFANTQLNGGSFIFTMKSEPDGTALKTIEFTESKVYDVVFEDDFTKNLSSNQSYYYDIMWHVDGERFPQCSPSTIIVLDTIGGLDK